MVLVIMSTVVEVCSSRVVLLMAGPTLWCTLQAPASLWLVIGVAQLQVQQMVVRKGCLSHFINIQEVEVDIRQLIQVLGNEPDKQLGMVPRMKS